MSGCIALLVVPIACFLQLWDCEWKKREGLLERDPVGQLAWEQPGWLALNSHRTCILCTDFCLGMGVGRKSLANLTAKSGRVLRFLGPASTLLNEHFWGWSLGICYYSKLPRWLWSVRSENKTSWRTWYWVTETQAFPANSPGDSGAQQTLKTTVLRERLEAKYQKKNESQAFSSLFIFVFDANYYNFCTTFETSKFSFVLPFSGRVFITMILKIVVD